MHMYRGVYMFNKRESKQPISARIGEALKERIVDIQKSEEVALSDVIESFLLVGLKEYEKPKDKVREKPVKSNPMPPSLNDVTDYFVERGSQNSHHEAESFVDFYQSKGWVVGKNKMKDWKASVRNWMKKDNGKSINPSSRLGTIEEQAARILGKNDSDVIDADFSRVNNSQMERK